MYTLNELATMTGLTTRTLRTYLKTGLLSGEKTDGVWHFSEEDCEAFFSHPSVKPALQAKRSALVYDFLGNRFKRENELCVVLDLLPQAGGMSGNGKERLRDYSVSRVGSPRIPEKTQSQSQTVKRSTIETDDFLKSMV